MYKMFFQLSSSYFICSFVFLIAQMSFAEAQSQSGSSPPNYKLKPKAKYANKPIIPKTLILVPPPPPDQPSILDWSEFGGIPDSISYLNTSELSVKLEHMRKQISNANLQIKDDQSQLANRKDKGERFDDLYKEGVVSRKELETAKKEVTEMERLVDEEKNDLTDLELQEGAIIRQLNLRKHKSKTTHKSQQTKTPGSKNDSEKKSK